MRIVRRERRVGTAYAPWVKSRQVKLEEAVWGNLGVKYGDLPMKIEQFVTLLFCLIAVIAIGYFFTQAYDEIEYLYDPLTGRQSVKARKSRMFDLPTPLTLEGK